MSQKVHISCPWQNPIYVELAGNTLLELVLYEDQEQVI